MSSVYSNGIHSDHTVSQYNRVSLGCGEMGFSRHVCVADNCAVLSFKYGPKSLRNVSQTLLHPCHEVPKAKGLELVKSLCSFS